MFKSFKGVVYQVSDLEQARHWYAQILGIDPVFDSPFAVHFIIDGCHLALVPSGSKPHNQDGSAVVYWGVDDIPAAYLRLLECGATPYAEIQFNPTLNASMATVVDPSGNVLGIMGSAPDPQQVSPEQQPSPSALSVAFCRAFAASEPVDELRGPDYLAEAFLAEESRKLLKDQAVRTWIRNKQFVPGVYEYFVARTAYLDAVVKHALEDNIPQLVFLGAGYDTRPYRFRDLIRDTRIFELDGKATQQRKRVLLNQAHIPVPDQVTFLPINFARETLANVLDKAGYAQDKKALFIWEGVTYYLPAQAVEDTLTFVVTHSPAGSSLCFDYMMAAPDMAGKYGAQAAIESMQGTFAVEPLQFRLEEDRVAAFLAERGYQVVEHLTAEAMQQRYLTRRDGSSAGKVVDLFGLVQASVLG